MENPMSEFAKKLQASLHAGCNFASVLYVTKVTTAAKYKSLDVTKVTKASIQLFSDVKSNPYVRAVERSVEKLSGEAVDFTVSENWFTHSTNCYSVVKHNNKEEYYLYALYNSAQSTYFIDGVEAQKSAVLELLTPSARKAATSETTYNATNDITHNVTIRTIKLENVRHIKVGGQTLTP